MKYYCLHCYSNKGLTTHVEWDAIIPPPTCAICGSKEHWTQNRRLTAIKADNSKLPLDLLDAAALEGIAAVLAFGANKYAAHNWRGGFKWSRLLAAMLRHTFAIMRGEFTDPESGLPHIDHVGCCWMFLSNHMKTGIGENDLYFKNSTDSAKSGNLS